MWKERNPPVSRACYVNSLSVRKRNHLTSQCYYVGNMLSIIVSTMLICIENEKWESLTKKANECI